jgi:hypothetical protein
VLAVSPVAAQEQEQEQEPQAGQVAESSVGKAGQRQTRAELATQIVPTARLDGRISNRIQSRIRNRIDRNYDPSANATSPFKVAADQARRQPER